MAEQHLWFYQKSTLLTVVDEGPFTDNQLLQLAKECKISLNTAIRSPTRTKNQWINADKVSALAVAINQAKLDADARKTIEIEERRKHKRELAIIAQEQKLEAAKTKNEQRAIVARKAEAIEQRPQLLPALVEPGKYTPVGHSQTTVVVQQNESNAVPVLLNIFLWPGLGQLVQGRAGAGIVIMMIWFGALISICAGIGLFLAPVVWLIAVIDAALYKKPSNVIVVNTRN